MVGAINAAQTVNYGSIDNRINRAKEHAKNNLTYGAPALAAIGATGIVGAVKPDLLTKTATAKQQKTVTGLENRRFFA